MRLAIIPMYSSPHNIRTDSVFNGLKVLVRAMVEAREDAFIYITVPEDTDAPEAVEEAFDHPRILAIRVPAKRNQYLDLVTLPDAIVKRFSEVEGDLYVDAVLTSKAAVLPYLNMALHTWGTNGSGGIKLAWLNSFFMRSGDQGFLRNAYFRDQTLGLASADALFWIGEHIMQEGLSMARDTLSFAELRRLREKSHVSYWPVKFERLQKYRAERDPNGPRVLNFAYALNNNYNTQDVLEVFDYLFARGNRNVRVLVTTPSLVDTPIPEDYKKYMDIHLGLPQEQFFQKISTAHAFVMMPRQNIELSPSVIEQQYLGLVGVFPDRPFTKVHCYPGYPYIGKNKTEVHGMLRYVLDHYHEPDVQEVIRKQREYIEANFSAEVVATRIYDTLKDVVGVGYPGCEGQLKELLTEAFKDIPEGQRIEYDEWCDRIKGAGSMGHDPRNIKPVLYGLCKNRFRKAMELVGFKDTCDSPYPAFVRA